MRRRASSANSVSIPARGRLGEAACAVVRGRSDAGVNANPASGVGPKSAPPFRLRVELILCFGAAGERSRGRTC